MTAPPSPPEPPATPQSGPGAPDVGHDIGPDVEEALHQLAHQLFGEAGVVPGWINACGQADRTVLTVEPRARRPSDTP